MKHSVFLFVVVLFSVSNIVGQEPNDDLNQSWKHAENRHELKFHIGLGFMLNEYHAMIWDPSNDYYSSKYKTTYKSIKEHHQGCYGLKYSYDFFDWINVGLELGYQRDYSNFNLKLHYDSLDLYISYPVKRKINSTLILPSFEFKYLNKKYVQLYGKVNVGVGLFNYKDKATLEDGEQIYNSTWSPHFIAHFSPIGVRVGRKYASIVELGLGAQAFLSVGFSAKF